MAPGSRIRGRSGTARGATAAAVGAGTGAIGAAAPFARVPGIPQEAISRAPVATLAASAILREEVAASLAGATLQGVAVTLRGAAATLPPLEAIPVAAATLGAVDIQEGVGTAVVATAESDRATPPQ